MKDQNVKFGTECKNTHGSYDCVCSTGMKKESDDCVDIDECSGQNSCASNQICHNVPGSYLCLCKSGFYRSEPTGPCSDIKECNQPGKCDFNAICEETPGQVLQHVLYWNFS